MTRPGSTVEAIMTCHLKLNAVVRTCNSSSPLWNPLPAYNLYYGYAFAKVESKDAVRKRTHAMYSRVNPVK